MDSDTRQATRPTPRATVSRILITGISGMDGSLMAEFLLSQGCEVYGLVRRSTSTNHWRIAHFMHHPKLHLIEGDVTAPDSVYRAIQSAEPEYVYHLASQSFVPYSWASPAYTLQVTTMGTINVLEAIRIFDRSIRVFHASSSETFGRVLTTPQSETTPFHPRSPYGIAKLAAHNLIVNYRESFGIHACSGILFNHEHQLRGDHFVARKITKGIASFFYNKLRGRPLEPVRLGNLNAQRDWGYAPDFVEAMVQILTHKQPETFVVATGVGRTVRSWCEETVKAATSLLGLPPQSIQWTGADTQEVGYFDQQPLVVVSKEFFRPTEGGLLLGDASKAKNLLGWQPITSFETMIDRMFTCDYNLLMHGQSLVGDHRESSRKTV